MCATRTGTRSESVDHRASLSFAGGGQRAACRHEVAGRARFEGTNEVQGNERAQFVLRIGLDETWYRTPDSRGTVSYVSAAFIQAFQETHETHETGPIGVQIGVQGGGFVQLPREPIGCVVG
jgi:hypothetical protein